MPSQAPKNLWWDYQQPWYWLFRINGSNRNSLNYLCQLSIEKVLKNKVSIIRVLFHISSGRMESLQTELITVQRDLDAQQRAAKMLEADVESLESRLRVKSLALEEAMRKLDTLRAMKDADMSHLTQTHMTDLNGDVSTNPFKFIFYPRPVLAFGYCCCLCLSWCSGFLPVLFNFW